MKVATRWRFAGIVLLALRVSHIDGAEFVRVGDQNPNFGDDFVVTSENLHELSCADRCSYGCAAYGKGWRADLKCTDC